MQAPDGGEAESARAMEWVFDLWSLWRRENAATARRTHRRRRMSCPLESYILRRRQVQGLRLSGLSTTRLNQNEYGKFRTRVEK